jgi:hypothetical protein
MEALMCGRNNAMSAKLSLSFPTSQDRANSSLDLYARLASIGSSRQQAVVIRLPMPDVSGHSHSHRRFIQALRRSRTAHAPAVFLARVFGYRGLSSGGTAREEFSHSLRELLQILQI